MYDILKKLFLGNNHDAFDAILQTYEEQKHCVISYIYFGPIVTHRVFASESTKDQKIYKQHLLESDFLLPDGIALQVFYFIARLLRRIKSKIYRLPNLNGTDFFPYFIKETKKRYGAEKINYIFYGVYDQREATLQNQYGAAKAYGTKQNQFKEVRIAAIKKYFDLPIDYYYESNFTDNSFSDFPFEDMEKHLKPNAINIVMNCRGVPRQEFWSHGNMENIKKYRLLVFNQ
jgi:UDP-N-acetyl-D-mannosaminuronic acid transferase (WecB/TagA/CpsF family)